jgi:hypothetical protein
VVTERALVAGDLATAHYAARKASDLSPGWAEAGAQLQLVATLAGDADGAQRGTTRAGRSPLVGEWPPTLATLMALAPEHALLALPVLGQ